MEHLGVQAVVTRCHLAVLRIKYPFGTHPCYYHRIQSYCQAFDVFHVHLYVVYCVDAFPSHHATFVVVAAVVVDIVVAVVVDIAAADVVAFDAAAVAAAFAAAAAAVVVVAAAVAAESFQIVD